MWMLRDKILKKKELNKWLKLLCMLLEELLWDNLIFLILIKILILINNNSNNNDYDDDKILLFSIIFKRINYILSFFLFFSSQLIF